MTTTPHSVELLAAELVSQAESHLDAMISDIEELVTTETPSADHEAVAQGAKVVARLIKRRLGADAEVVVVDGVTHLRVEFGDSATKVLLLNHQDTVWPMGTLQRIPFQHSEGVLRGPGVFDMLTGLVMSIYSLLMLKENGVALDGVTLLVTGDEEVGSTTSRELIEESAQGARAALVMEAAAGSQLKVGRKGTSIYSVTVHGRAAHAGLEPEKGINAGLALGLLLPEIDALSDVERGTTVTPTVIAAGTTTNTVPELARVDIDVRAKTIAEQERVDLQLRALRSGMAGASVRVTGGINRPPMERTAAMKLYETAVEHATVLGIAVPGAVEVGGASDGNFTAALGVPTLDGMGATGDGAHAEHEHTLVENIAPRTALLASIVANQLQM